MVCRNSNRAKISLLEHYDVFFISNALYQNCMTHDHNDHWLIKCFQNAGKKSFGLSAEYTFCLVEA